MKSVLLDELSHLFVGIKTRKEAREILKDMFTPAELADMTQRWQLIKRLTQGMPHRKISAELGISIAKVTRGSKALQESHGGFRQMLRKIL